MRENWAVIREAIGSPSKCGNLPGYFKVGGKKIRDDKDIAKGFNDFFSTIGTKLDSELSQGSKGYKEYLNKNIKSRFKLKKSYY